MISRFDQHSLTHPLTHNHILYHILKRHRQFFPAKIVEDFTSCTLEAVGSSFLAQAFNFSFAT